MVSAIVLAAGKGSRFYSRKSKVAVLLEGKPVIYYSLSILNRHNKVDEIVVVANSENIKEVSKIIKRNKFDKVKNIVLGGQERSDSVLMGLRSLNPEAKYVLIHDAARPFISKKMISSLLSAARKYKAAILGVPVKDTIKEVSKSKVQKTLKRDRLWQVQTPQVFRSSLIFKAYAKRGFSKATDDAMLVEKMGGKIRVVKGSYSNIKITTLEDLALAKIMLKSGLC